MSETLAAATLLGSLAFYVHGKRDLSLLFAAGAMLMKESSIIIPALIFILEWWRGNPDTDSLTGSGANPNQASLWRSAAWAAAPYVPLAVAYWIVRAAVMPKPPLPPGKLPELFLAGFPFLPAVAGRYIALLFFPWPMAFCYDLHAWKIPALGLGIASAWMAVAWKVQTLRHDLLLAGAMVLVFLSVPVASSPLMISDLEIQDRYAYLATTGACLAMAVLLNRLGSRWPRGALSLGVVLVALGVTATLLQERVWRSEEAMWANTVRLTPSSTRARFQLVAELARLQRPAEALRVCQDGRVYHPEQTMFQDCMGLSKLGMEYLQKHPRALVIVSEFPRR
jgi:hypothetical protein